MGCLKFLPAKRAWSPSSSSILEEEEEEDEYTGYRPGVCSMLLGCVCVCVYRSSWLYLAKRSERHGAPVLIWGRKERLSVEGAGARGPQAGARLPVRCTDRPPGQR